MQTARIRIFRSIFAFFMFFGVGGGCVAIYSFEDFEKDPPPPCLTTADCPKGTGCGDYICEGEICTIPNPVPLGTITKRNVAGDCVRYVCDGHGNEIVEFDSKDVRNDGDACTIDACSGGIPSNERSPVGTVCGTRNEVQCNAAGACAGCSAAADCGSNNECTEWACENSICIKKIKIIGTIIDNAVLGDCRAIVCNGLGETEESIVNADAPSDGNECTSDACTLEGEVEHQPTNIDTPCGNCGVCTPEGACAACDPVQFDCYEGTCIRKPRTCKSGSECSSSYCVDGYCCNTECSSLCMACSNDKTGKPSGLCALVTDKTDPDKECQKPESDTCSQGACRCENGAKEDDEVNTDCGGVCNPCMGTWNCGGDTTCSGVGSSSSCCAIDCFDCGDNTAACQSLVGQTCALGASPKKISLGVIGQAGCIFPPTACRTITCNCVP